MRGDTDQLVATERIIVVRKILALSSQDLHNPIIHSENPFRSFFMKTAFFRTELADIFSRGNDEYPPEVIQAAKLFTEDCSGAADGDMDQEFQDAGRGYYAHLHELFHLKKTDYESYIAYKQRLEQEIDEAEEKGTLDYQMSVVREQLRQY